MARPVNQEELEFLKAIEEFKKKEDKLFLSWTEVLSIVKDLGYSRSVKVRSTSTGSKGKNCAKKAGSKRSAKATPKSGTQAEKSRKSA